MRGTKCYAIGVISIDKSRLPGFNNLFGRLKISIPIPVLIRIRSTGWRRATRSHRVVMSSAEESRVTDIR